MENIARILVLSDIRNATHSLDAESDGQLPTEAFPIATWHNMLIFKTNLGITLVFSRKILLLISHNVSQSVTHETAQLDVGRAFTGAPPAFQGTFTQGPPAGQLFLGEQFFGHVCAPLRCFRYERFMGPSYQGGCRDGVWVGVVGGGKRIVRAISCVVTSHRHYPKTPVL